MLSFSCCIFDGVVWMIMKWRKVIYILGWHMKRIKQIICGCIYRFLESFSIWAFCKHFDWLENCSRCKSISVFLFSDFLWRFMTSQIFFVLCRRPHASGGCMQILAFYLNFKNQMMPAKNVVSPRAENNWDNWDK